jgi:CheY-like chemotaxis protein
MSPNIAPRKMMTYLIQQTSVARSAGPLTLFVVEDNEGDVRLVREALATLPTAIQLSVVNDGQEALRMLQEAERKPDLVLLDLKLPSMDGHCLLSLIKVDPKLRRIPVIILTSSTAPRDVRQAYDLHANCYLVKPPRLADFMNLIHDTIEFWTSVVKLPGRS